MALHHLGPYPIEVADLFREVPIRDKPPLHAVDLHANGMALGLTVILGKGNDETRAEIASTFEAGLRAARHVVEPYSFQGNSFVLHRFEEVSVPHLLGVTFELYLGFAFGDLIDIGFNYLPTAEDQASIDSMRMLAMTMMTGAIVTRGYELARPAARKSWLERLFR